MNIGVIGVGWWGRNIVHSLEHLEGVSRITAFDERPQAYSKLQDCRKIVLAKSMAEVLTDRTVAGICLATPPATHFAYSKQVLLAGKHLLVEKPPAHEEAQIRELGTIAGSKNLVYMLDALYLFLEPIQRLKQMITSGELKNIRYIQMFRIGDELRRPGAGIERLQQTMFMNGIDVIEDLFFHDAAILLDFFGDFEYLSSEKLCLYHPSLCDTARVRLKARGVPVELTLSWAFAGRRRGMVIYDRDFIVEYDGLKNENQITKFHLTDSQTENYTFAPVAPLGALLEFYLRCIEGKNVNTIGYPFMEKITGLWKAISHEQ